MHYVYVLQSKSDGRTYVGSTNNVERRFLEHNAGRSKATKHRKPFILLFTETFDTYGAARKRESWWKSGAGRKALREFFAKKLVQTDSQ